MKIKTALLILGLSSLCLAANDDKETTPREKSMAIKMFCVFDPIVIFISRTFVSVQHRPVPQ